MNEKHLKFKLLVPIVFTYTTFSTQRRPSGLVSRWAFSLLCELFHFANPASDIRDMPFAAKSALCLRLRLRYYGATGISIMPSKLTLLEPPVVTVNLNTWSLPDRYLVPILNSG